MNLEKPLELPAAPDDGMGGGGLAGAAVAGSAARKDPERRAGIRAKDGWDKAHLIAQMLAALVTVIVAGAAAWYGYSFNRWQADQRDVSSKEERAIQQRHLEILRVQAVQQFLPYLVRSEPEKRAAFLAIRAIADAQFTTELAELFPSDGAVEALGVMATGGTPDQRRYAVAALVTIATRGGEAGQTAASQLADLAQRSHTDESQFAREALERVAAGYRKSVVRIQGDQLDGPRLGAVVGGGAIVTLARGLTPGVRVQISTPAGAQDAIVRKVDAGRGLALLVPEQAVLQGLGLSSNAAHQGEKLMTFAPGTSATSTSRPTGAATDLTGRGAQVLDGAEDRLRVGALSGSPAPELVEGAPLLRLDGTIIGLLERREGDHYDAVGATALRSFVNSDATSRAPAPKPPKPPEPAKTAPAPPPAAAAPAPEPPPKAVRVGGRIERPVKVTHIDPVYPPIAISAHMGGTVVIEATIGADGVVQKSQVVKSTSSLFNQSALDAVRQWRYKPTLLGGSPVPVVMTVTVNFSPR